MLTLYYVPGSSSMASHLALEEAGAEYELKFVDEDAGEQRTEAYLQINPRGKVPALRLAGGTVLVENLAIQTYVARTHPAAKLLPGDPEGETRALSLMSFFASAVHPALSHVWRPGRYTDEPSAEAGIRAKGRETFFGHCREIDTLLVGREWFLDQFSTVDSYGFVFYGWGTRVDLPMHELRSYTAHKDRMLARPAVRRVLEREGASHSPEPGFPRWIGVARAKALEFLAKTQIPTFTHHSVARSPARSWQTLEPRAEFVLGTRERQAYLGNPG